MAIRLVVLAPNYNVFQNWIEEHFPYYLASSIREDFIPIIYDQDINRLDGRHRGLLYVDLGSTKLMRAYCRAKSMNRIQIMEEKK